MKFDEAWRLQPSDIHTLSSNDLPEIYRLASLFITASEIETQGIVLLEAAASGLPIVSVHVTCIPEIVHHGENGFLSEPGDLDELSHCMMILIQDPILARRMGEAGRRLAEPHDRRITMDAHENLYRELTFASPTLKESRCPSVRLARRELKI